MMDPSSGKCLTGDTETFTTLGSHNVQGSNGSNSLGFHVSSAKVTGDAKCQVSAFKEAGCSGTAMGLVLTPSTQVQPDGKSDVYDAGVVTPGGNLKSVLQWDNDQTKCIKISCGESTPAPTTQLCPQSSAGKMYAAAGSSEWSGMDMAGQSRSTETSAAACQTRCASTTGCAYFTFWTGDGGCHLQDNTAVLRQSPGDYPTKYGSSSSSQSSDGKMYAAAGSSEWSGMDMAGQSRSTETSAKACQTRCEGVAGCAFFTFWKGDGGCHLQDSTAVLRQSPGDYPTEYGASCSS